MEVRAEDDSNLQQSNDKAMTTTAPNASREETLRLQVGDVVSKLSSTINDNLMIFRWGCIATMVGCAYISIRSSGLMTRYNSLQTLPVGSRIKARVVGQSALDPSILYVYHTPWLRRVLLKDTLPREMQISGVLSDKSSVLAVRPYGIEMQDEAKRWLYIDYVASRRYVNVELLYRPPSIPDTTPVGACAISTKSKLFFNSDMSQYAVSRGLAICKPEPEYDLAKPNMSSRSINRLDKHTKRLESCQGHAQVMRYGIWEQWKEDDMSKRIVSASKRATHEAMQRIFGKLWTK